MQLEGKRSVDCPFNSNIELKRKCDKSECYYNVKGSGCALSRDSRLLKIITEPSTLDVLDLSVMYGMSQKDTSEELVEQLQSVYAFIYMESKFEDFKSGLIPVTENCPNCFAPKKSVCKTQGSKGCSRRSKFIQHIKKSWAVKELAAYLGNGIPIPKEFLWSVVISSNESTSPVDTATMFDLTTIKAERLARWFPTT